MRHYAYRTTFDQLNNAFAAIFEDGGQVVSTLHVGGRGFVVIYTRIPVESRGAMSGAA